MRDRAMRRVEPEAASPLALPPIAQGGFRVRLAESAADLDAALRLRFEVFNVELAEGLASSWASGRDEDRFDAQFDHLLVEAPGGGRVVGTYRVQTAEMAAAGHGFYSADEFDLSGLPAAVVSSSVEAGRACIARDHRNRSVLYLLWKGLAAYLTSRGKSRVFGCSSLTSSDPRVGLSALAQLERGGHLHPTWRVRPLAGFECRPPAEWGASALPDVDLPVLFRTYLRFGGKICGPPAIDRAFRTIDFLTLLDVGDLDPEQRRLFF